MKRILVFIFLALVLFSSSTVYAVDDSHKKAAEKLLDMIGMKNVLEQSIEQMLDFQLQQQPALMPYKEVMMKFLKKHMSFESLKNDFINMYVSEFTEKELNDITEFYQTPTGKKTIEKIPALMAKGAQIGEEKVRQNLPELQEMIRAEAEKIQQQKGAEKNK